MRRAPAGRAKGPSTPGGPGGGREAEPRDRDPKSGKIFWKRPPPPPPGTTDAKDDASGAKSRRRRSQRDSPAKSADSPAKSAASDSIPQDLEEVLDSLGIGQLEDLAPMAAEEPLSAAQVEAFRAVFELFATNSQGNIDAVGLSSLLDNVNISLTAPQTSACLQRADYDGDGLVGFQDFLSLMTDSQKFARCMRAEPPDPSQAVEVMDTAFYKALDKMLDAGLIPSSATGEIVRYYHKKLLSQVRRAAPQAVGDRGHVITYYAKGAHLVGLQPKQLRRYIQPHAPSASPYSKQPSLNLRSKVSVDQRGTRKRVTPRGQTHTQSKTWRTVEIEERIRQLSVKHPGKETKDMITPVQIKVDLQVKDRENLTYDDIDQIRRKSREGLNSYLQTLTQYKRRDAWTSWGSLQSFRRPQGGGAYFPDTFSTYSWSWSGRRNMLRPQDLQGGRLTSGLKG